MKKIKNTALAAPPSGICLLLCLQIKPTKNAREETQPPLPARDSQVLSHQEFEQFNLKRRTRHWKNQPQLRCFSRNLTCPPSGVLEAASQPSCVIIQFSFLHPDRADIGENDEDFIALCGKQLITL